MGCDRREPWHDGPVIRRLAAIWVCAVALALGPAAGLAAASGPDDTEPVVTLADGKTYAECVNLNPKPGCTTRKDADGKQLAVFGVMAAGLCFVGWRVARQVRRRDRIHNQV